MRASCFSVSHLDEPDFEITRKNDEEKIKQDLDKIGEAIEEVLADMKANWQQYAVDGFEWFIKTNFKDPLPNLPLFPSITSYYVEAFARFMNEYYNYNGEKLYALKKVLYMQKSC